MITSHRDRRAFQNYGYFSRSSPDTPYEIVESGQGVICTAEHAARLIRLYAAIAALVLAVAPMQRKMIPKRCIGHLNDMFGDHFL
jgi:hypothetical protein